MAAETAQFARGRVLQAFRSRDFRLLWGGQTVSLIGDGAFLVALGWRTTELTGRSSSLALVLMLHGLGLLTTLLIGGALADRYPRRLMMIASDLARFGTIAALAVVDATGNLSFPLLLVIALVFGLGDGFFYPAFGGMVPLVVEQPSIASANSLIGVASVTARSSCDRRRGTTRICLRKALAIVFSNSVALPVNVSCRGATRPAKMASINSFG